jgi:adenylate kinase family enzyme
VHRPDDQPAVAASRFALYEENEHDVVTHFQASATLKRLAAGVSAEDILEDVASVLAPVLKRRP